MFEKYHIIYLIFLDSAWTEKLMGTPNVTDNYRGYEDSDLNKKAMTLDKKLLMLIHGSADETVHYQHSMMLIRALTEKGILFRHQVRFLFTHLRFRNSQILNVIF